VLSVIINTLSPRPVDPHSGGAALVELAGFSFFTVLRFSLRVLRLCENFLRYLLAVLRLSGLPSAQVKSSQVNAVDERRLF